MDTIQIKIRTNSGAISEMVIAELAELNFYAFQEEENFLSAFIKEENFSEETLKRVCLIKNFSYEKLIIADTNWNAKWECEFKPIIVDQFVAIRANFHKPVLNVKHEIIITPKMSFGTGHHATTFLMLKQMESINFKEKTVLDFGTGTGILAILAKKLGAKNVVAIDNDLWSIKNAEENIIANDCSDIELLQKDDPDHLGSFDIILANINLNVLTVHSLHLKNNLNPSAILLLSGFLLNDQTKIADTFVKLGLKIESMIEKEKWLSMLITNR